MIKKAIRLLLMRLGWKPPLVSDDFSCVDGWCHACGGLVIVIRVGDYRCEDCEN